MGTIKKIIKSLKNNGIKGTINKLKKHFQNEEKREYYKWIRKNTPSHKEIQNQRNYKFQKNPKISIIIPLYNTPKNTY